MSNQTLFTVVVFNSLVLFLPIAALILWKRPSLWLNLFTIFLGIIVGWIDLKTDEVVLPVFLLLTFGFFAGFARPKSAWLFAIMLAMWIPVFEVAAIAFGTASKLMPIQSLIAFIPSFAGACGGALIRSWSTKVQDSEIA